MTSTSTDPDDGPGPAPWPQEPGPRLERLVHDLRSPLSIVSGFSDLLVRRTNLTEEQRAEFLERVAEAARELTTILDSERADRRG
jgi:signal transduction histidine kinase